MPKRIPVALAAAVWLATSAAAQPVDSPPPKSGDLIVRGHAPETPEGFAKDVEQFVHDHGRPGPLGRISRWEQPVCPKAVGLSPAFNDFVARRISDIAARAGAPVG